MVASSPEQFNVNAARPYVSFVSYFRNDGYTSDFDLRVRRATSFLVRQLQRGEDRCRAHPGRVESAGRPAADHRVARIRCPRATACRCAASSSAASITRSSSARGIGHEPRRRGQCRAAARPGPLRLAQGVRHLPVERDHRHHRPAGPARERAVPLRPLRRRAVPHAAAQPRRRCPAGAAGEPGQHALQPHSQSAAMVHPRAAHQRLRRLPADEPRDVARPFAASPWTTPCCRSIAIRCIMHAAVALGLARDPPAAGLSHLQGAATTACSATASATSGRRCSPRSTRS